MTEPRCIVRAQATTRDLHLEHVGDAIGADREPPRTTQPNTLRCTFYENCTAIDDDGLPVLDGVP